MHTNRDGSGTVATLCSTPEGVTDRCTGLVAVVRSSNYRCSTPEGVTDRCTVVSQDDVRREPMCSTPEGVTDRCTTTLSAPPPSATRAQRPRASLTDAHESAHHCPSSSLCSTPEGVTDRCTPGPRVTGTV